jgi:hypothetical protein
MMAAMIATVEAHAVRIDEIGPKRRLTADQIGQAISTRPMIRTTIASELLDPLMLRNLSIQSVYVPAAAERNGAVFVLRPHC